MTRVLTFAACTAALAGGTSLDVHVYDQAGVPASVFEEARRVLARTLENSGIELRWIAGEPWSAEATRVVLVDPSRRQAECGARRDIALAILQDSSAGLKSGVLGYAEPWAPAGINATVYLQRVTRAAREHRVRPGVLLAHAMAHEIGHVLLRRTEHSGHGMMAGGWDASQFQLIASVGLVFDRRDNRRMQETITGARCQAPDPLQALNRR